MGITFKGSEGREEVDHEHQAGRSDAVVFLLDVDNTLLDSDRIVADLKRRLQHELGPRQQKRYWEIFDELHEECEHADYLGALQRYCDEYPSEPHLTQVSSFLIDYPFANRLYPHALDVVAYCRRHGVAVIFSDGDTVFQPRKIKQSGLEEAVNGHMLVYARKEKGLKDVAERHPAEHYVMVDDNVRVLCAVKEEWKDRVTTVFIQQGHYASDPARLKRYPSPDISLKRIGDLLEYDTRRIGQGNRSAVKSSLFARLFR